MNKAIKILTVALVLQVLLVVLANLDHFKNNDSNQNSRLLSLDWSHVDGLRIAGKDSTSVLLKKKSEHEWILPDYYSLPVDSVKIDELLDKLKPIHTDWPVATTEEAAKRFEVSKDNFQRQLNFLQGDTTKSTLLTGTSPGYRKVHAKLADQSAIYAIELSNFLVSASAEDWLKKQLLALDLNQVKEISIADIHLTKPDKDWLLDGLSADQKINHTSLQTLLDTLTNFRIESAFGPNLDANQLQNQVATLAFDLGSDKHNWAFYEPKEGAYLILKSTQNAVYFKVNRAEAEKITTLKRQALIQSVTSSTAPVTDPASTSQTESTNIPKSITQDALPTLDMPDIPTGESPITDDSKPEPISP